jgi:uncharacterized protein (DUF849 family)
MAKPKKVIITCAVTGAIHTLDVPHLPVTPEQIRDEALAAAKPAPPSSTCTPATHTTANPPGPRRIPQIPPPDQSPLQRRHQPHHRRRPHHGRRRTPATRTAAQAEVASLNMGSMNFGLYEMLNRFKDFKYDWERPYLEGSDDRIFRNTFKDIAYILESCSANQTRFEIECYDIGHLYTAAHFIDRA